MEVSKKCVHLVAEFEGLRLKAYPDPATGGEPITIGYGTTIYPDGKKVKLGDIITEEYAKSMLLHDLNTFSVKVSSLVKSNINQNQFDALVSFSYNVGVGNLKKSTLLKKVNISPNDKTISAEFMRWNRGGGKILKGLIKRRRKESELYFT